MSLVVAGVSVSCGHTDVMAEPSANVRSAVNFWD